MANRSIEIKDSPRGHDGLENRINEQQGMVEIAYDRRNRITGAIEKLMIPDENLQLVADYGRATETRGVVNSDLNWVYTLRKAGIDEELILKVWEAKDERERDPATNTPNP